MDNNLIKKISSNPALVAFCNRILSYNTIFEDGEARRLFLASLISADALTDAESCREALETAYFVMNHMDFFQLEATVREEIENCMENVVKTALQELRKYKKEKE